MSDFVARGAISRAYGSSIRERKGQRTYAWPFYAFTLDPPQAGRAGSLDLGAFWIVDSVHKAL